MTDINAVITKFKDWEYEICDCGCKNYYWRNHKTGSQLRELPDFQHDARLYMALYQEMADDELLLTLRHYRPTNLWLVEFYKENATKVRDRVDSNDKGTAICLAYMRLHGLE